MVHDPATAETKTRDRAVTALARELQAGLRWRKFHYRSDASGRLVYGRLRSSSKAATFEPLWVELCAEVC